MRKAGLIVAALALSGACWGQLEQTKVSTDDPGTVAVGEWELELTAGLARAGSAFDNEWAAQGRGHARATELGVGLTTGLTDTLDLGISTGWAWLRDEEEEPESGDGPTDLSVGMKWNFVQEPLAGALTLGITAPTGEESHEGNLGPGEPFWSAGTSLVLARDLSARTTGNLEVWGTVPFGEGRGQARGSCGVNAAAGYQATDLIQPEVELNWGHEFANGPDADEVAATLGLVLTPDGGPVLSLGVQRVVTGRNADRATSLLAAATWAF